MQFFTTLKMSTVALSVSVAMTLSLSACSHENSLEQTADEDVADYQGASCAYKFDEGGNAVSLRTANIRSSYFKKNFDVNLLLPVLNASGEELVRFAKTTNVQFYRTEGRTSSGCKFGSAIPEAPSDLDQKFKSADFRKGLLGLYLPEKAYSLPSTQSQSAIVVRIDTNKWVLIHEFMHHLFRLQEMAEGFDFSSAPREQEASEVYLKTAMINLRSSSDKAEASKDVVTKLKDYNKKSLAFIRTFAAEEMTIESVLGDRMDNGDLGFVYSKQRLNGAWYIVSNSKKAVEVLEDVRKTNKKAAAEVSGNLNSSDALEMAKLDSDVNSMEAEIDNLVRKAKSYVKSQGYVFRSQSGPDAALSNEQVPPEAHTGCTHGEIPAEVADRIKNFAESL